MTILLGFLLAAGAIAVVVFVSGGNDPGYAEAEGFADGWGGPARTAGYQLGQWAAESPAYHHSEPTLEAVTTCLYCGSAAHSTFLHASR